MSDFGQTQTSQATLGGNTVDIPVNSVVPDGTITPVAVAGGPSFTDTGKARAPVSLYVKDGNDTTQGAKADSAATDSTSAWSVVALLKGILAKLLGTLSVSGAVTTSGTVTEANSAAIKTDLDTLAGAVSGGKAAVKAASGDVADGAITTLGNKTDAKSTATDATSVSAMAVLKEISAMAQAPASTPVTGTFWQATQPISAASLPALPPHQSVNVDQWNGNTPDTNSGIKSAGTLRVVLATDQPAMTNAQPVTANAGTNLNTSALALEAGHLANIDTHTPTQGQATMTNSSPVVIASNQSAFPVTQGAGASAGTNWRVAGDFTEYTGLSAGALNADLVATLDVSLYKSMGLQINGNAFVGTLSFRWSDDGVNFYPLLLWRKDTSSVGSASLSTTSNAQGWYGNLACHYLQIRMTSYTSGAAQATLDLFTQPVAVPVGNIAQSGTWTMQPGNTQNTTPWLTQGPTSTGTQAANTAGNTVIKGSAGALWSATITTLGTAGLDVFDNASTNAGTKLLSIPASAPVGSIYSFPAGQPAANGIVSAGVTNCPAVTFSIR